jgi:hypothetical protein
MYPFLVQQYAMVGVPVVVATERGKAWMSVTSSMELNFVDDGTGWKRCQDVVPRYLDFVGGTVKTLLDCYQERPRAVGCVVLSMG